MRTKQAGCPGHLRTVRAVVFKHFSKLKSQAKSSVSIPDRHPYGSAYAARCCNLWLGWRLQSLVIAVSLVLGQDLCLAQTSFLNPDPITVPDQGTHVSVSTISVSGVTGRVSQVTVTLNGLSHAWLEDLSVLLLGPGGQQVTLFSGAGRDCRVENAFFTFDDSAPAPLPIKGPIGTGNFQPSNYATSAGFPSASYASALSVFNGSDPNGVWSLLLLDNAFLDTGTVAGGWELSLTVDSTAPTIAISGPSTPATSAGPVNYTVEYSDANFLASSLTAADVILNPTGTANGTVHVSGSGTTRTVTISGITGDGSLGISLVAGTATDSVGNAAAAAGPSASFAVSNTPPSIAISSPSTTATANGPVTYQVTYANIFKTSTLATKDVILNRTGNANGTVSVSGSKTTRTVTISKITGNGTLGISIKAGTATDLAGNPAPAVGPSTPFTVSNTVPAIASISETAKSSRPATNTAIELAGKLTLTANSQTVANGANFFETRSGANRLTIANLGSGRFRIGVISLPGQTIAIEHTSDAAATLWLPLRTVTTDGQGRSSFDDTPAADSCFYRLAAPPSDGRSFHPAD